MISTPAAFSASLYFIIAATASADGIASWRGDLFVAEWGEYLHTNHGRRLVRIERGHVTTFATGFDHPLALAVDPSGGLLVADWGRGVIYEIRKR